MDKGSDQAYTELCKRIGDPKQAKAALADLYNLCRKDFMKYIRAAVGDDEAVKDIFEDLMVEVCQAPRKVAEKKNPKRWMLGMVRNLIRRYYRTNRNMPTFVNIDDYLDLVGHMTTDERLRYGELVELMARNVAGLSPKLREVFLLYWDEGLSIEETATRLDKSVHTVRKQLAKAIKKVGRMLAKQWGVEILRHKDDNDHDT